MRNKQINILFLLLVVCTAWITTDRFVFKPKPVKLEIPKGWPQPVYDFTKNPLTQEGILLGKTIFYDPQISKDGTISCGSCHQQFGAFNTYDHNLSHGLENMLTTRNAPALFNLAWQKEFMWDGGINHLDLQFLAPLTAHNEMGETVDQVITKMKESPQYKKMFKAAFGDEIISTERIGKAISQFLLTLVSSNSKYDKVKRGEANFNLPEGLGYEIFKQKCISCHTEPFFTDFSYRDIGIPEDAYLKDKGRMKITGLSTDSLKFRVPSLRNVAVSFPYGHDGRFYSLMNVFEHYRRNMVVTKNTDPILRNKLPLSNYEIGQLKAFLGTLTDSVFLQDIRFAPPGINDGKPPVDNHQ
ncbi:MAG: cytochrome-c peroxidase [Sediminibacterium sp.]|nr:cytochrome-c peroxidase [Sediminibacterium sp.]MBX9779364.1 cytochrome-c peroxidase [Chitinophagaceae bacterium]